MQYRVEMDIVFSFPLCWNSSIWGSLRLPNTKHGYNNRIQ